MTITNTDLSWIQEGEPIQGGSSGTPDDGNLNRPLKELLQNDQDLDTAIANSGNMLKSVYDTNDNGIVDNSEALGGSSLANVLDRDNHTDGTTNKAYTATEKAKLANVPSDVNTELSLKADSSDVLERTNTTSYTPTSDYHPSTKKYVDDQVATVSSIALDNLTNVSLTAPVEGSTLIYNSITHVWEDGEISTGASNLSELLDVTISGISDGDELRYNSTSGKWENGNFATFTVDQFTGNGIEDTFTLSETPASEGSIIVSLDGIKQSIDAFSLSGSDLIFTSAPGSVSIEVTHLGVRPSAAILDSRDYILITDEKADGVSGGSSTLSTWSTRDINTIKSDSGGHSSVATNQITLAAGTYEFDINVPGYSIDNHQARLRNITDGTTISLGTSEYANNANSGMSSSNISGKMTLASSKVFEIQHNCSTSQATNGFGIAGSFGEGEVYTVAKFWKIIT